jgi:uncharacterized membrane protein YgdD (TMEM256/DUF423 family)
MFAASICGMVLVTAGAAGGHSAISFLETGEDLTRQLLREVEQRSAFDAALLFGFVHTLAALLVSALALRNRSAVAASWTFLTGVVLFSFVLCLRYLTANEDGSSAADSMVMLIPVGGIAFMAGWLLLVAAVLLKSPNA